MTEEIEIQFRHSPEVETARRMAWVLSQVEHQLGIVNVKDLPLSARVENALQGCMHNPAAVEEDAFKLLHLLKADNQPPAHGRNDNEIG